MRNTISKVEKLQGRINMNDSKPEGSTCKITLKHLIIFFRLVLTGVLLFFVFGETGVFTTICFALLCVATEIQTFINNSLIDSVKTLNDKQ